MNKERLTAFTDAIVAIAATIMVLEIKVPDVSTWDGLLEHTMPLVAYLISFSVIFLSWRGHQVLFDKISQLSSLGHVVNALWILCITLTPVATGWVGRFPHAFAPEMTFAVLSLVWILSFIWLSAIAAKENPDCENVAVSNREKVYRIGMCLLGVLIVFIQPVLGLVAQALLVLVSTARMIVNQDN